MNDQTQPATDEQMKHMKRDDLAATQKLIEALGSGADEGIWPPGMDYREAAAIEIHRLLARLDAERKRADADERRLRFIAGGDEMDPMFDGFGDVKQDVYELAYEAVEARGAEEPTPDDMLEGMRKLIDLHIDRKPKPKDTP